VGIGFLIYALAFMPVTEIKEEEAEPPAASEKASESKKGKEEAALTWNNSTLVAAVLVPPLGGRAPFELDYEGKTPSQGGTSTSTSGPFPA
jgi:hypothetical protein